MIDSIKSKKVALATSNFIEIELKKSQKTLHCWRCGESGHVKNDPNFPEKKAQSLEKSKQKIEVAKVGEKSKKKELKCTHCSWLNHDADHCFILHPQKKPTSKKEKALEVKIVELEKRFNIVALLG